MSKLLHVFSLFKQFSVMQFVAGALPLSLRGDDPSPGRSGGLRPLRRPAAGAAPG